MKDFALFESKIIRHRIFSRRSRRIRQTWSHRDTSDPIRPIHIKSNSSTSSLSSSQPQPHFLIILIFLTISHFFVISSSWSQLYPHHFHTKISLKSRSNIILGQCSTFFLSRRIRVGDKVDIYAGCRWVSRKRKRTRKHCQHQTSNDSNR